MQATTTQAVAVLRLPQEILEHLASHLGPGPAATPRYSPLRDIRANFSHPPRAGLLEMSATCKELRSKLEKLIATLYFQDKAILIADASTLEALLGIPAHPYFSKAVKHVDFCLAELEDAVEGHPCCDRDGECFTENREREHYAMPELEGGTAKHREERDKFATSNLDHIEWCKQSLDSPNSLLQGSGLSDYLNRILTNFKNANNIPSLAIKTAGLELRHLPDYELATRQNRPLGLGMIVNGLPYERYGFFFETDVCDHRAFDIFYQAIADNQYPVTSLEIGDGFIGISILSSRLFRHTTGFENLRELKLAVELVDLYKPGHEDRLKASLPQFICFLRVSTKLEILVLTIPGSALDTTSGFDVFTALAEEAASSSEERALRNIRELELIEVSFEFADLVAFVSATRSTLQCLRITEQGGVELWRHYEDCGPRWKKEVLEAYGGPGLELVGEMWTLTHCRRHENCIYGCAFAI